MNAEIVANHPNEPQISNVTRHLSHVTNK